MIFLASCGANNSNSTKTHKPSTVDSLIKTSDSVNDALRDMKSDMAQAISFAKKIVSLKKEKELYEQPVVYADKYSDAYYLPSDDKDKKIRELTEQILFYERENARLRKRIEADSLIKYGKIKPMPDYIESDPPKPDGKSLIVNLDKRMRGDGDISDTAASVYRIPYSKKIKKYMRYDIYCAGVDLSNAKQAYYYGGLYFFNDVPPGEYLIKVCAYYGNYKKIKRETDGYQMVTMQMSPPIQ